MQLTFILPVSVGQNSGGSSDLAELARAAETAGMGALAYSEHPAPSRKWLDNGGHDSFDPLVGLAFCAAATSRIRLMTLLLVLPYRNPLLAAKSIASLDVLSGGRLTVVAGAGYLRSEFLALGVDFEERNALLDESLAVLDSAWRGEGLSFTGRHFDAIDQGLRPPPVQLPRPPIWLGGNSKVAKARAIRMGNGWAAVQADATISGTTRTAALETIPQIGEAIVAIREDVASAGGDPRSFQVQVEAFAGNFAREDLSYADRLDQLRALAAVGADHAVVHPPTDQIADATRFVREVGARLVSDLS